MKGTLEIEKGLLKQLREGKFHSIEALKDAWEKELSVLMKAHSIPQHEDGQQ